MARITFSPLIAGASGKAADAVFSKWKSTPYVRKRVVPANPQSAAQTLMRDAMGRMAYMWRKFRSEIQDLQNTYATNIGMSGFNWFSQQNAALEKTYDSQHITPPDADVEPPQTITLTDQSGGTCKVDWTGGATGANIYITVLSRRIDTGNEADYFDEEDWETTLASAGTVNVTLAANQDFRVVIFIWDSANSLGSMSISDEVSMGA